MRTRKLAGVDVPVIGLGTWNMERDDAKAATAAIHRAIELGLTHIDTAEMYGSGRVEKLVGEALAGRRDRVFLVSKVLPSHGTYDGVLRACEASLQRLRTDHLDLYLLHWRDGEKLADVIRAFEQLRTQGKIRAWGVSNFDVDDLEEANRLAPGKIACNQVLYHLQERTIEQALVPWCDQHGVAVVAYSPLGATGGFPRSRELDALAKQLGKTPRQVALAFLARRAFVIPKSSDPAHVEELASADFDLDPALVDRIFPVGTWRGLPTL